MPTAVLWFRRDLRLRDHPALVRAAAAGSVLPLFVLDDRLLATVGDARVTFLIRSLAALDRDLRRHGPGLVIRRGPADEVVPAVAAEAGADSVHITEEFTPYGRRRDRLVATALGSVPLVATGSPYAVAPGSLRTGAGESYQVFTPFYRAWLRHGWPRPAESDPDAVSWLDLPTEPLPAVPPAGELLALPEAGEQAAYSAWERFRARLTDYPQGRDRPAEDATSGLSTYLKWGAIHPRTILAELPPEDEVFRRQLAWREFFGAALDSWPHAAHDYLRPQLSDMPYVVGAEREERYAAWRAGRTGYPLVDAGMRQLLAEGWMHNRVRMLVASFLVKDLKIEWTWGARHFLHHLIDADVASNQLNWQWVAGSGLDAAPYFRIFNPVTQSRRFDPDGAYLRRWIPELADLPAPEIHEPWRLPEGPPAGYPLPIVDHDVERRDALAAYAHLRRSTAAPS